MEELAARIRKEAQQRPRGPGKTAPYPEKVRGLAREYVRRGRARGMSWSTIGKQLGIRSSTLQNWYCGRRASRKSAEPTLRPVRVKDEPTVEPRTFSVTSPAGFRIDGLSIEEAAVLLVRLS